MNSIIMINPFVVFEGREDEFLELWDQTNSIFRTKPGYISARLTRALKDQPPGETAPFTHVNVAIWSSATAYADALRDQDIRRFGGRYMKVCTYRPALYEVVREI